MVTQIPYGTRYLIVTCFDRSDSQFKGLYDASRLLGRHPSVCHHHWEGQKLDLPRRRTLQWVLLSGHGAETMARIGDNRSRRLCPGDVRLPSDCSLYLLGCHQGCREIRAEWAAATGVPAERVLGCCGETDSALSTLLLLHAVRDGIETIPRRFPTWMEANDYFRCWFPEARRVYQACNMEYAAALEVFSRTVDVRPFEDFLSVGEEYLSHLSGLDRA